MVAAAIAQNVRAFFAAYGEAFNALDAAAVSAFWNTPSGIAQNGKMTWWPDAAPMQHNTQALCEVYRKAGYARAEHELLTVEALGPQFVWVNVQWTLWRTDGSVLQRFRTAYQLVHTEAGWRVLMCTAYEEDLATMRAAAP